MHLILISIAFLLPFTNCWGFAGHEIIAEVASTLIQARTTLKVAEILENESMSAVAAWVKFSKPWSRKYHYVSPKDCSYNKKRDCADGKCIVSQVWNQTLQLQRQDDKSEPLMFLIHLIGDLMQPLHVCGRDAGGNANIVVFDKISRVSLHAIWDSNMPKKRAKEFEDVEASYPEYLASLARTMHEETKLQEKSVLRWTKDTQSVECERIWRAYDNDHHQNFGMAYYEEMKEIIDEQLAKAAYRLAKWLDLLLGGKRGREQDMEVIAAEESEEEEEIESTDAVVEIVEAALRRSSRVARYNARKRPREDDSE